MTPRFPPYMAMLKYGIRAHTAAGLLSAYRQRVRMLEAKLTDRCERASGAIPPVPQTQARIGL